MIENSPWAKYNAKPEEWVRDEFSYQRAVKQNLPEGVWKHCMLIRVYKEPIYSMEDSKEPEGFQDIATFAASEDDREFEIAKRLVDLETQERVDVGDFVTLKIKGCCNIVGIIEE